MFSFQRYMLRQQGESGASGSGGGQDDDTKNDGAKTDDTSGQQAKDSQPQNGGDEAPKFTQAQLDAIVKDRLERERKKTADDAEKARKDAEAIRLKEQGEFQKLAEQRQTRITELEAEVAALAPVTEERDRYKAALETHVTALAKDLPDSIKDLLTGKDPVDQIAWLDKHRESVAGERRSGPPPSPKAADPRKLTDEDARVAAEASRRSVRARF